MKHLLSLLLMVFMTTAHVVAQDRAQSNELVRQGLELQEKGQHQAALKKFEQALQHNPLNVKAKAEKGYVLVALREFQKALDLSEQTLAEHSGSADLLLVYINRGNALDYLGRPQQALQAYKEGLSVFPNAHLLHLNKGITHSELGQFEEAQLAFENCVLAEPEDVGGHLAMGHLAMRRKQYIPALLAYGRSMVLEPEGSRAKEVLRQIQWIMQRSPDSTTDVNLSTDADKNRHHGSSPRLRENDFRIPAQALALSSSPGTSHKSKVLPAAEQFAFRFSVLCASLRDNLDTGSGFYWNYYAPYFSEMYEVNMITTFAYLVHASTRERYIKNWVKENERTLDRFYSWSEIYPWPRSR